MSENIEDVNSHRKDFICGVVEGFYGRPWTTEQRKDLFQKMSKWGMDTYVYAPKDDYKHRAYWREMYTVEEAEHLSSLISAAKQKGIEFCYALSPGLDIAYSNSAELAILKRKLEQVAQFGCTCFALLFDDIETEMCDADKKVFQSFAHAQVSITNEIYQHLGCPKFLICPTQYCSSRAVPNVESSEYLNTLGTKLSPEIDIMWTGSKVITKTISRDGIEEITQVLKRKPVIWDNIHANDYDQKRIFLGPYFGRSPELIPLLRGVLTNPNCEYNANHVAIYTLAHWANCRTDANNLESLSWDVKLEREGSRAEDEQPPRLGKDVYHHRTALRLALEDWLPEFRIHKDAQGGPVTKPETIINVPPASIIPIVPSVNTCMSLASATITEPIPTVSTSHLRALADVCGTVSSITSPVTTAIETLNPASNPIMNSLVSPTKVVTNDQIPNPIIPIASSNISIPVELPVSTIQVPIVGLKENKPEEMTNGTDNNNGDMDDASVKDANTMDTPASLSPMAASDEKSQGEEIDIVMSDHCSEAGSMQVEPSNSPIGSDMIVEALDDTSSTILDTQEEKLEIDQEENTELTVEDLDLLVDLMYLPFSHGGTGLRLLHDIHWLMQKSACLLDTNVDSEAGEWRIRLSRARRRLHRVQIASRRLLRAPNRGLARDFAPYLAHLARALRPLHAYLAWLELGKFPSNILTYTEGAYNWFSKGWKDAFECGNQEPWVFRGGLGAELRRLLPADCASNPNEVNCVPRPYCGEEVQLRSLCLHTADDGKDASKLLPEDLQSLPYDCFAAPFIEFYPHFCIIFELDRDFTVEDSEQPTNGLSNGNFEGSLVGFICGSPSALEFRRKVEAAWTPHLREKYPKEMMDRTDLSDYAKDLLKSIHAEDALSCFQDGVANTSTGVIRMFTLMPEAVSGALAVVLSALKSHGCFSIQAYVKASQVETIQMYAKYGFGEQSRTNDYVSLVKSF